MATRAQRPGITPRITVLVVHHEPAVSRRLRGIFRRQQEVRLLAPFRTGDHLASAIRRRKPQLLFLDTHFTRGDGDQLMVDLRQCSPGTKVILLDTHYTRTGEVEAARSGARGYLGGVVQPEVLRKTVRATMAGEVWIRRKTASYILDEFVRAVPLPSDRTFSHH
jgi:DNA-binding NarL/FixJ family response regulator